MRTDNKFGLPMVIKMGQDIQIEYLGAAINYSFFREVYKLPYNLKDKTVRIVRTEDELLEKVRIFEMGMDDRIIEILKVLSFMELTEEVGVFDADYILCWVNDDKTLILEFFYEGKSIDMTFVDYERYEFIYDALYEHIESVCESDKDKVFINQEWAFDYIAEHLNESRENDIDETEIA